MQGKNGYIQIGQREEKWLLLEENNAKGKEVLGWSKKTKQ